MFARKPFQLERRYPQVEYTQPKQLLPALRKAVSTMNHGEIRTVQALLVRAVNDFTAGMVLHRLLEWMPFSKRHDGGIWKSDRDWNAELGLTYTQMARVRRLLRDVVQSKVKRAQGSPTYHYWLDGEALLRKIAVVYDCTVLFARVLIYQKTVKTENGNSENINMDVQVSSTSIFRKPEKHEQDKQQQEIQEAPQQKIQTAFSPVLVIDDGKTETTWDVIRHQLEMQLDRTTWAYVKGASAELCGDVLTVRGAHPQHLRRISRNIARLANDITNTRITIRIEE